MMNASSVAILRRWGFGEVDWTLPSRSPAALPVAAAPMAPDKIARAVRRSMEVPFPPGLTFEFVQSFGRNSRRFDRATRPESYLEQAHATYGWRRPQR